MTTAAIVNSDTVRLTASALLTRAFAAWRAAGIPFVVLRNHEHLPESISNDVDVLVPRKQHTEAEQILLGLAQDAGCRCLQRLQFAPLALWFSVGGDGRPFHIDLYPDLRWHGVAFLPAGDVLSRRQPHPSFDIPDPVDEALINLLSCLLYRGRIKPKYRPAIQDAARTQQVVFVERLAPQFGVTLATRLATALAAGQWTAAEGRARRARRQLWQRALIRQPVATSLAMLGTIRRLLRRFLHPSGLFLVFVGPDGVGKSTVIAHLETYIEQSGLFNGTVIRHWRPELLPPLATLAGRPPRPPTVPGYFPPRRKPGRFHWARLLYYAIDFGAGCWLRDRLALARHRLVIYDRFVLDMAVDPFRYGLASATGVGLLWRLVPRPDAVILLRDTPPHIHARKQELSLPEIEAQLAHWQRLASSGQVSAIVAVAGDAPDAVARRVLDLVTEKIFARSGQAPRQDMETLRWLDTVVSPGATCLSTSGQPPSDSAPQAARRFAWIAVRDGRGYLLPLDDRSAILDGLNIMTTQNLRSRLARTALKFSARAGILPHITRTVEVKRFSTSSANGTSQTETLFDYLQSALRLETAYFAIALGAPGVHRTPVFQVMDHDGHILAYAKIGWNPATNEVVTNEADSLRALAQQPFEVLAPPRVLHAGWWQGRFVCIQSSLQGQGLTASPLHMTQQYLAVVQELAVLGTTWMSLAESPFWQALTARIQMIPTGYYRHVMGAARTSLEETLAESRLPFHFAHGDFTPWNTRRMGDRLLVFDWEYADPAMPPGWDLMRFFMQTMVLCENASAGELSRAFALGGLAAGWLGEHLSRFGIERPGLAQALFGLHLLHHLTFTLLLHPDNVDALLYLTHALNLTLLEGTRHE